VKQCTSSSVDSSSTLFAIGGILIAIVALIPTFWIDGKIRDTKKEISRDILEDVQKNIKDLSKAQMLILEADKHEDSADLLIRDALIQEATYLWPAFKQEEYRKIGNILSLNVINDIFQSMIDATLQRASTQRNQTYSHVRRAIFYLEATVFSFEAADRDCLVNLACMLGCDHRYEDMVRIIERAIKLDENAKDDLREAKRLSLLTYACESDRRLIEKLGNKIGKVLPLSKADVVNVIRNQDRDWSNDIKLFAMKRSPLMVGKEFSYIINITATTDVQGRRLVNGFYCTSKGENRTDIPSIVGQQVSIEDFFDEIDKELYVICLYEYLR
jgi:hypothetical protein